MELFLVIVSIISLVVLYFLFGIIVKFILGWIPLFLGIILGLVIGLQGGIIGALIGIILFIVSILVTNSWHDIKVYLIIEEKLDSIFYFKD